MKIKITAPGLFDGKGEQIPVGTRFTVKEEPTGWAGRYEVLEGDDGDKTPVTNPDKETAAQRKAREKAEKEAAEAAANAPKFTTEAREGGFVILNADGEVQGAPLTEADAKTFDELPADQQAEFVAGHVQG